MLKLFTLIFLQIQMFDFLPVNYIQKTFQFVYNDEQATSFLIEYKKENYFVTAKHIFKKNEETAIFKIKQNNGLFNGVYLSGKVYYDKNPNVDIAVIKPNSFKYIAALSVDTSTIIMGDSGYFLGFPYGLSSSDKKLINDGFPIPLVKKAVFSGSYSFNGLLTIYLDGHNNPGFSGGPIIFKDRREPNSNFHIIGVISGYYPQSNKLKSINGDVEYFENSGIILGVGSKHIIDILESIKK